jgi:hypothetical protein
VLLGSLSVLGAREAAAQPITAPGYRLDIEAGPLLGSARVIGLGGAYASIAEGAAGMRWNPAAAGNRMPHAADGFDWDLSADFLLGLSGSKSSDFDGDGRVDSAGDDGGFSAFDFGALIQKGVYGLGAEVTLRRNGLASGGLALTGFEHSLTAVVAPSIALPSLGLVLSPGLHVSLWQLELQDPKRNFGVSSVSGVAGVLFRPVAHPVRVGGMVRLRPGSSNVTTDGLSPQEVSDRTLAGGLFLPGSVEAPWAASAGVSWRIGNAPYNPRPRAWGGAGGGAPPPERYWLLTGEVGFSGAVPDAYAPSSFFDLANPVRARDATSITPRAGMESELWPDRLRARVGFYLEPARFVGASERAHFTASLDIRTVEIWGYPIRLSLYSDNADSYNNGGASIGIWH